MAMAARFLDPLDDDWAVPGHFDTHPIAWRGLHEPAFT
jgi:hypothetical protein